VHQGKPSTPGLVDGLYAASYPAAMHLDKLCSIEFRYLDAHFPKPYGDESGPGWGIGEGTVSGERLSGTIKWSNHPSLRSDGVALPDFRGVISTADDAKVLVSLTGRTVFVPRGNQTVGRQLLMALFESDDEQYTWLNSEVGIAEGIHDPQNPPSRTEVYLCTNDLV
jgi:uncharacterized protein DUF3237